ncbi:UNVERIFIED_ORG: hypothetical protein J2791_000802 [Burkholderia contaminans]|nr:hypothetical protein [Burkholderia contaminans]
MVVAEGGKAVLLDFNEDAGARLAHELGGRPGTSAGPRRLSVTHDDRPASLVRRAFAPVARHPGPAHFPDSGGRPAADV